MQNAYSLQNSSLFSLTNFQISSVFYSYPLAELVICAGFFIIYLIEAMVNQIFGLNHAHGHSHSKPKNEVQTVENGGIDNMAFNESSNDGPRRSPPDTPNTTGKYIHQKT